jgi:hypothetical protein
MVQLVLYISFIHTNLGLIFTKIKMRNILKYLITLIAPMSCEDEKSIRADYIIENQTTYNLSITGYTGAKAVKTIEIKPNSIIKKG